MALTDKKYANEHPKFNMFDKYKANKDTIAFEIYWPELLSEDIQRRSVGKMNA